MPTQNKEKNNSVIAAALTLVAFFYSSVAARTALAPVFLLVQKDLMISSVETGTFFMIGSIGQSLALVFSSFPASRYGHRRTIMISSFFIAAGCMAVIATKNMMLVKTGFFIIGTGAGLYLPSGVAVITGLSGKERAVFNISLHEMAPPLAFISTPLLVNWFLSFGSWRLIFIFAGGISLLCGFLVQWQTRGIKLKGRIPDVSFLKATIVKKEFWVIFFYFIVFICTMVGVFAILPTFLVSEKGFALKTANYISGLTRIPVLAALLVVSHLIRRLKTGIFITIVFFTSGLLLITAGISTGIILITALLIQPFIISFFSPKGFLMITELTSDEASAQSTVISLVITMANLIGNGIFPVVMAWLADNGRLSTGITVWGMIVMFSPVLYLLLKGKKEPV